ncbi:MAG: dihydrofolate reductase family protein, partial [Candidatus Omnitrophica bacterium]|nr:dihydrofolate reductase family protein [Candidatus Omnitrophota bacterium]
FIAKGIEIKKNFPENVEIIEVKRQADGLLDINDIIFRLHSMGIGRLIVQGGTKILTTFFNCGLFDDIYVFVGGKILGGPAVYVPFEGKMVPVESQSGIQLDEVVKFKNDVLMIFRNVLGDN